MTMCYSLWSVCLCYARNCRWRGVQYVFISISFLFSSFTSLLREMMTSLFQEMFSRLCPNKIKCNRNRFVDCPLAVYRCFSHISDSLCEQLKVCSLSSTLCVTYQIWNKWFGFCYCRLDSRLFSLSHSIRKGDWLCALFLWRRSTKLFNARRRLCRYNYVLFYNHFTRSLFFSLSIACNRCRSLLSHMQP